MMLGAAQDFNQPLTIGEDRAFYRVSVDDEHAEIAYFRNRALTWTEVFPRRRLYTSVSVLSPLNPATGIARVSVGPIGADRRELTIEARRVDALLTLLFPKLMRSSEPPPLK